MPPAGLRAAAASVGTPSFSCLSLHRARLLNTHIEPNHALARDSFPYILSTADAVLFFCYNSRKPA